MNISIPGKSKCIQNTYFLYGYWGKAMLHVCKLCIADMEFRIDIPQGQSLDIDYEAVRVTQEEDGTLFSGGERIRHIGAFLLRL